MTHSIRQSNSITILPLNQPSSHSHLVLHQGRGAKGSERSALAQAATIASYRAARASVETDNAVER